MFIDLIPYKEHTMHNTYRLAGHTVKIESVYPQVHTLCADYRTDDSPEYDRETVYELATERDGRSAVTDWKSRWTQDTKIV